MINQFDLDSNHPVLQKVIYLSEWVPDSVVCEEFSYTASFFQALRLAGQLPKEFYVGGRVFFHRRDVDARHAYLGSKTYLDY